MLGDVVSVELSYTNNYRMEFQYYAEFLRYIGVYVYENFQYVENEDADFEDDKSAFSVCYQIKKNIDFSDEKKKRESLQVFLEKIFECRDGEFETSWLSDLVEIYEKNKLLQASVTLQYFRTGRTELALKSGKKFETAADELVELVQQKNYWEQKNIRYAKLYCKQKANLGQYSYDESVIYYIDQLALEGLSILKKFPDFSNVWVLVGMIYDLSPNFIRECIEAYDCALDDIKDKPYASSVYYWKARRCETDTILKPLSDACYRYAYNSMKKYRNIYKIANLHVQSGDLENAIISFKECLVAINKKGKYLDPLELEYCFKVNMQISSIYLQEKQYTYATLFANNAIKLREDIIDEKNRIQKEYTNFVYCMYKDMEPNEYIDYIVKRMSLQNVYRIMAISYQECGLQEEADKYWNLYRMWL